MTCLLSSLLMVIKMMTVRGGGYICMCLLTNALKRRFTVKPIAQHGKKEKKTSHLQMIGANRPSKATITASPI